MTKPNLCSSRLLLVLLLCLLPSGAAAKKKKKTAPATFSYYLLSLSWAPDFCAQSGSKDPAECGAGRKVGFVVHGLWPQDDQSRGPENCGGSPVSQAIVQVMLNYIPTQSLIQHEWTTHGTCTGLSAADYFALVRKARDEVNIPADLKTLQRQENLSPAEIEAKFAAANSTFPTGAFRVSCTRGELQEARICFNKDLTPRNCTSSAGECSTGSVLVRPVR